MKTIDDFTGGTRPSPADPATGINSTVIDAGAVIRNFCLVLLQLILVAVLVQRFAIEEQRHFLPVFCYAIAGFVLHFWLPVHHRLLGFALLSIGSVLFVLGTASGLSVVAGVAVCVGICFLPVSGRIRLVMLITAGITLVVLRALSPSPVWPVLGSMLMFRLFLFAFEFRQQQQTLPGFSLTAAYFLMIPHACFPFFPVVDFRTFQSSRYNAGEWEIYQRGVNWIVRGIVHLLLYRLIRDRFLPDISQLQNIGQIGAFMVANYALYLQVSGQFHVITGMLHLFGFNLPRTHNQYFLASSFSDIWRRINIYWKDFMTKCFFFPAFFWLRRRGFTAGTAVTFSVLWVFLGTWLLHSWQTWWLLGRFPITWNDAFLWLGVGICVAFNAAIETRFRALPGKTVDWVSCFRTSAQTVGMFLLVSAFWASWTKPDFLLYAWTILSSPDGLQGLRHVVAVPAIAVIAGAILIYGQRSWMQTRIADGTKVFPASQSFRDSAVLHLTAIATFLAIHSVTTAMLPQSSVTKLLVSLQSPPASTQDALMRGYYEDLNAAVIQAGPLLESFSEQHAQQQRQAQGFEKISRSADLYQGLELIPGIVTDLNGSRTSINQFGMRDRDSVSLSKLPNTTRIAIVGSSIVMGYGVTDDEAFCRVFESLINDQIPPPQHRMEVLNFGVGKQYAPHRLVRIQRQVLRFSPDVLIYMAHQDELTELAGHAGALIAAGLELPSMHLEQVAARAGVSSSMAPGEIYSRLLPLQTDLLKAVYQTIADECARRSIRPVWIYLPIPDPNSGTFGSQILPLAESAGFSVFDATHWHRNENGLFPSAQDYHPTPKGHRLIAESLVEIFRQHELLQPEDSAK